MPVRLKSDRISLSRPNNPDGGTSTAPASTSRRARGIAQRGTKALRAAASASADPTRRSDYLRNILVEPRGVEPLTS